MNQEGIVTFSNTSGEPVVAVILSKTRCYSAQLYFNTWYYVVMLVSNAPCFSTDRHSDCSDSSKIDLLLSRFILRLPILANGGAILPV